MEQSQKILKIPDEKSSSEKSQKSQNKYENNISDPKNSEEARKTANSPENP